MDMLSVLLHEYGHVLGIAHSADAHDAMAASLQPGMRRLPSAEEMTLMSRLVAELRSPDSNSDDPAPSNDHPSDPALPTSTRTAPGTRLARRAPATGSDGPSYQGAVNPTLANGDFGADATAGWVAEGAVAVDGSTVTLAESATGHSHLAQGFVVNPGDRLLSFTLDRSALAANVNGPGDAFEAALLNANTGLPALGAGGGTIALSRSDALLNLQTNGTERLATGVRKVLNPDGSATYFIQLPATLAGTPVYLSFDLLGFRAASSKVTLRDIRLHANPVANPEAIAFDEDTAAAGNLLANDITVGSAVAQVQLVAGPTHGTLSLADNGSFSYMPATNWYGADAFSYRLIDAAGRVSNTATVTLTIRAVNDAPTVVTSGPLTIMAGKPLLFDPLVGAADVEGAALSVVLLGVPLHGSLVSHADGSVTYTADIAYVGADAFSYRISDGQIASAPVTLQINVLPANTAPVANNAALRVDEDGILTIDFAAFGSDTDALTATITAQPQHGTLVKQPDGNWRYTPNADFHGTDTLRFKLNDGRVDSNEATLTITVDPINDVPTLSSRSASVAEDGSLLMNLLAGASDIDGDTLTAAVVTGPAHGTLRVNPDGSFTYAPHADYFGTDSFTWRVGDGTAFSSVATAQITVTPVNDAPLALGSIVTGIEDTALTLRWSDFGASDIEASTLTLTITELPVDGKLQQRNAAGVWVDTLIGARFTEADFAASAIRFVPVANASGGPGYAHAGLGNRRAHYARIGFSASDGSLSSAPATLTIDIAALADAPTFTLQGSVPTTRELFRTGWEAGPNADLQSSLVTGTTFDGWTLVTGTDKLAGGINGFEVWANGDTMADVSGTLRTVSAAAGNGARWLELNDAGAQSQTLGIERDVTTQAGAAYTLSFDAAGRLGYSAAYTRIVVFVDGVQIAAFDNTSASAALDWRKLNCSFTGAGGTQRVRIVTDGTSQDAGGRGMMVDNIAMQETVYQHREVFRTGWESAPNPDTSSTL